MREVGKRVEVLRRIEEIYQRSISCLISSHKGEAAEKGAVVKQRGDLVLDHPQIHCDQAQSPQKREQKETAT